MEAEKCTLCFYWDGLYCRRNAPVALISKSALGTTGVKTIWPTVRSNDWCGEFTFAVIKEDKENEDGA